MNLDIRFIFEHLTDDWPRPLRLPGHKYQKTSSGGGLGRSLSTVIAGYTCIRGRGGTQSLIFLILIDFGFKKKKIDFEGECKIFFLRLIDFEQKLKPDIFVLIDFEKKNPIR